MRDDPNSANPDSSAYLESQFYFAFESLSEGVAICMPVKDSSDEIIDLTYLYINPALEGTLKLKREDIIGRRMSSFIPDFPESGLFRLFRETLKDGKPRKLNSDYLKKMINGQMPEGYYDSTLTSFGNGVVITVHNITDLQPKELELQKAAGLMTNSEEDLRLLFENSFDALLLTDPKGDIYKCNAAAEKLFGYSEVEICRLGRIGLADPTDENWNKALMERKMTGKFFGQLRYKKKDGTVFTGECSSIAFTMKDGSLRTSTVIKDITDRIKIEEQVKLKSRQLQDIIDGAPSTIFVKDLEGRYLLINRRMEEILSISSEEIKGKTDFEIIPKDLAEYFKAHDMIVFSEGKAVQFDEEIDLPDGKHQFLLTNKFPLFDEQGKIYGICGVSTDLTELKLTNAELKQTMEALKRSNSELEQFAYIASHDLQEPLRMVSNYAQLLLKFYSNILDQRAFDFLNFIVAGTQRMNSLIQDLLSYARVTSKVQPFSACDLNSIVKEVLHYLQVAISESNAEINYDNLPEISGDPLQMKQLVQNLLTNAIKFSGGNKPVISISAERKEKEWIFRVKDNGIGIKPEQFENIFLLLHRLHSKEEYPGTGIGLALCKKIVERHGGRIWVESEEGKGSTFCFTLPA
ncbi:MAG: PAS domain S-box protein [Syntrophomonadaceae bacterium]